jgi:ubiquinone/menaquinone biosynthesis C-methylase UbiE
MLNPSFPKSACDKVVSPYVAPNCLANRTIHGNESNDTGTETRLQPVYGEELWLKLERAGFPPAVLDGLSVLEVCAGTGFLTFHLLSRCTPKTLTVNDISASELSAGKKLMFEHYPKVKINWVLGDMHTVNFEKKFDLIIGNSFLHHFHNVPDVLNRFQKLLSPGGSFITLHEPTPTATFVESARVIAWPLAVFAPSLLNNLARARYKGKPSSTDLWMFEPAMLRQVAVQVGFKSVHIHSWGLMRPIMVQRHSLHTSKEKPTLNEYEIRVLTNAIKIDSILNRFLPKRCFGSMCIVLKNE